MGMKAERLQFIKAFWEKGGVGRFGKTGKKMWGKKMETEDCRSEI